MTEGTFSVRPDELFPDVEETFVPAVRFSCCDDRPEINRFDKTWLICFLVCQIILKAD